MYPQYYAKASNERWGLSPRLSVWATHKHRGGGEPLDTVFNFTGPGIYPKTSRAHSCVSASTTTARLLLTKKLLFCSPSPNYIIMAQSRQLLLGCCQRDLVRHFPIEATDLGKPHKVEKIPTERGTNLTMKLPQTVIEISPVLVFSLLGHL